MDKVPVRPITQVYRLLNPGPVVLVTVGNGQKDNLFTVAWNVPVRQNPPMLALLVGKGHYSYGLITESGEFGVNIPDVTLLDAVLGCGSVSGREVPDKFASFGLTREPAQQIEAPLVLEAVANIECRICQVVDLGSTALLIAQALEAVAAPRHFKDGSWTFDNGLQLIHHLGGERFCVSDRVVQARRRTT